MTLKNTGLSSVFRTLGQPEEISLKNLVTQAVDFAKSTARVTKIFK